MSEKKMIGENQKKVFKKNTAWRLFFLPLLKFRLAKHKSARFSHSYQEMMAS